ncbi:suppressor protein SRP40 [Daphnia magna]|uniref:suppressor protein SRP40 n=1 Tax=Daphnia magna TaxID=35525 RepID=UPI001E1BA2CF|nr:suppressor protein SRP40 [Daphnia magna]
MHFGDESFRSHSVSENPKLLSNAVPSIFVGVFDAPNNSGTPPLEEELLEPPTKKIRLSYVVTHEFDGDLPVSEDAVVGVQEIHNPPNHIAVNGSGDEEKDSANDSGPVRDISASKLSESEGDFHISSHHSDSGCHYSSSTSFNSDSECEWSASNSCDSDSECAWSSSNSSDTNSDWELSSQEDCDTDSDFQENELDHLETPDSDNDALLRPKPASSTENDLKLQKRLGACKNKLSG